MGKSKGIANNVLCGLMFAVLIPVILILWAKYTRNIVTIRLPFNLLPGYILLIAGAFFVCSGIWTLWRFDTRLPVNAFPTEEYLRNGIYGFTGHPICSGAVMISFGLSAVTGSASGFWLVSPILTLLIAAYVAGPGNEKATSVFGAQDYKPFLSLPSASDIMPSFIERLSSYFIVFVPWLIIYKAFIFIGAPDDAISTNLPFEEHFQIWEFSTIFYSFAFLFSLLVPLVVKTRKQLRNFITDVWFTIIFVGIIYLVFPLVIRQKDFIPHSFLGRLILYERSIDGESGALPSCHVIWAFLSALYFSRSFVRFKWIWYALAVLISVSCVTVGAHSILDVIAGFCTFLIVFYRHQIWNYLRLKTEPLSNSWKEWRVGPLKIINNGLYGGATGFAAGIIAHFIFSIDFFILLASFAMAAPWIRTIATLQYLLKGRSHRKPSGDNTSIHNIHPDSVVIKISDPAYVSRHPAHLYSIGASIVTGLVLIRLFNIGIPTSFIVGIYLILTATGRLVIESFRGDANIRCLAGMKISQWITIFYVLSGIIFTAIPGTAVLVFRHDLLSLILAIVTGLLFIIVSGINFPKSIQNFVRLNRN
jgi:membrane-associated phospholipid phosphatase